MSLGDLQPTYIGFVIHLLSAMDIPVGFLINMLSSVLMNLSAFEVRCFLPQKLQVWLWK